MTVTKETTVGPSPRMIAWKSVRPTPGHVEDALGDGRADDQHAEVGGEVGDDRDERVAQDVHGDDAVARESLARTRCARSPGWRSR